MSPQGQEQASPPGTVEPAHGAGRDRGGAGEGRSHIEVRDVSLAYGSFVLMRHISVEIARGEVFVIMGGSGCGKSTLMRALAGLKEPAEGEVLYSGESFTRADEQRRREMSLRFGVMFQSGALWSSLTLAENIAVPLEEYTDLGKEEIAEITSYKLALVGLGGFEDYYPAEISGGMCKRAGIARAMALDPEILFLDEPSAGLDPISAKRLDDLILQLRDSLGTTFVVVTHELASIFAIADNSVFLDNVSRTMTATGNPRDLVRSSPRPEVRLFLRRGEEEPPGGGATDRAVPADR